MWTADGMGDRKPGDRGFRAGRTGFSAARTADAEENPDDFVLPDFHWVLRPVNPAHVPDDSKAGSGGFTCKTATGSVVKARDGSQRVDARCAFPGTECHFAVAGRSCSLATMDVECAQRNFCTLRAKSLMDFLVVPLSDNVFVDVTPAIVVSNAGDDSDRDEFETDDVCC